MKARFGKKAAAIVRQTLAETENQDTCARRDLAFFARRYLRPYRAGLLLAGLLSAVIASQPFAFSLTARFMVDQVLRVGVGGVAPEHMDRHLRLAWWLIAFNTGIWAACLSATWNRTRTVQKASRNIVFALRRDLHEKLQTLHIGFFERMPTGKIMSRLLDDVNVLQTWISTQTVNIATHAFQLALGLALLVYLNPRMALLLTLTLPLYAAAFAFFRPAIQRTHQALRRLHSRLYAYIAERIANVHVVQAFAQEPREKRACAAQAANMTRVHMRLARCQQGITLVAAVFASLATGVITYVVIRQVQNETITLGSALAFIFALGPVFVSVNGLTSLAVEAQTVPVILRRIFTILETRTVVPPGKIDLAGMRGKIRFDQVSFSYPGQESLALQDVSFKIAPGEKIAIMGPSGAGKSTIFQLLLRFYDPDSGEVRVGGVNLQEASTDSIHRHVCMVQQEPVVFSGTLADNIRYGQIDAPPAEIMRAARRAELHDFIMELPLKYETEVGEQGVTLSGGQKQRLALATALLTDPEILLLDDTTSALDAETETRIRETLERVMRERTSLIITHRIATARSADRIFVLDKGRIAQTGTHETLSREDGFYRDTCRSQHALAPGSDYRQPVISASSRQ